MTSPTRPRTTASAFARMSVRSIAIAEEGDTCRRRPHLFGRSTSQHVRDGASRLAFDDIRYQPRTGSTNDDAVPLLARADAAGATLVADEQTAGRGRKAGRPLDRAAGQRLALHDDSARHDRGRPICGRCRSGSRCASPTGSRTHAPRTPTCAGPTICFVRGRKVAGILCVSRVAGNVAHVGCGVGINVARPAAGALAAIAPPPAFLSDARPARPPRNRFERGPARLRAAAGGAARTRRHRTHL